MTLRRLVVLLAAVTLLAACGSSGKGTGSTPTTTASSKRFVDAVTAGLIASTPKADRADLRCVGTAIVEGIGADEFENADVTLDQVRDPEFQPPKRLSETVTKEERLKLAERLQACGLGRMIGSQTAIEYAKEKDGVKIDDEAVACFSKGFDDPSARPMIANLILTGMTKPDAETFARLSVECFDMGGIFASAAGVKLSPSQQQCVSAATRHDPTFIEFLADSLLGVDSEADADSVGAKLGPAVIKCLTPLQLLQIADEHGSDEPEPNAVRIRCSAMRDASRAAAVAFYANSNEYPTTFTDLTGSKPPTLELPDGVTASATTLTGDDWTLTMAGTGPNGPSFTCS